MTSNFCELLGRKSNKQEFLKASIVLAQASHVFPLELDRRRTSKEQESKQHAVPNIFPDLHPEERHLLEGQCSLIPRKAEQSQSYSFTNQY